MQSGLRISKSKTKVTRVNTRNVDRIELDGDKIDEVEDFKNEELWTTNKQERITIQIRRRKWSWIGHTLRKTNCNATKQALRWNPQEGPKLTQKQLEEDCR